jgi:hypothetical protein
MMTCEACQRRAIRMLSIYWLSHREADSDEGTKILCPAQNCKCLIDVEMPARHHQNRVEKKPLRWPCFDAYHEPLALLLPICRLQQEVFVDFVSSSPRRALQWTYCQFFSFVHAYNSRALEVHQTGDALNAIAMLKGRKVELGIAGKTGDAGGWVVLHDDSDINNEVLVAHVVERHNLVWTLRFARAAEAETHQFTLVTDALRSYLIGSPHGSEKRLRIMPIDHEVVAHYEGYKAQYIAAE